MVIKKISKKNSLEVKKKIDAPVNKPLNLPGKRTGKEDDLLLQNFVSLQKVLVDLSLKVNDLTINVSKLLKLFELSAETLVKKDFNIERENEQEILKKIDLLLEQNKLVARGFTLMHEKPVEEQIPQSRTNMAPVAFQRTQGALIQSQSQQQNIPQRNPVQNPEYAPRPVVKEDTMMEVPGSDEETSAKNDNSTI